MGRDDDGEGGGQPMVCVYVCVHHKVGLSEFDMGASRGSRDRNKF